ncbi:hamartin [Aplysia californica]|uniref:Hamartin n=1 Tax=Aplysia californica TaxID=6500 RepID=A0ABM0K548_APLCA|nr:hamartin [Aplysia californica]
MASGGGGPLHMENIFQLLESSETVKDIRKIILENLNSTKETWLIHLLVDYYFRTQSTNVQEILAELREAQAKALIDKLHDGIKTSENRLPALQLVLYLVYRELPWCHQLVELPIFSHIIKCLRTEYDVPILMTAMMIVVILLPSVPVGIGPYLTQIFEVFERLSVFCIKKPANTPEVFVLHLQVSLYSLFHRLYGMYPCSFTGFISRVFAHKENLHVYQEVVMPMLERVRLHPKLVMGQKEVEVSANRWKNQETQDIIVACSKLSLDLIEGSWEDSQCPVFHSVQYVDKHRIMNEIFPTRALAEPQTIPAGGGQNEYSGVSQSSLYVPSYDTAAMGESPSVLIGLSTPPSSQRATPATSFLDAGTNTGTVGDTPEMTPRQHTPSQTEDGDKTPLSRSSSRGGIQQPKSGDGKRPVLATPKPVVSVPNTTPTTPGSNILASPLTPGGRGESTPFRSKGSAFASPLQSRSPAMRSLQFNAALEEKEEGPSCPVTVSVTKAEAAKLDSNSQSGSSTPGLERSVDSTGSQTEGKSRTASGDKMANVPMESLPHVISTLNTSDSVNVDQEVEEINEKDDQFHDGGSPSSSSSTTLASQAEVTAESVRQFMKKVNRIRFNSLTSNSSSSDLDTISVTSQVAYQSTRGRPRSCPPFKRLALHQPTPDGCAAGRKSKKFYSAVGSGLVVRGGPGGKFLRQKSAVEGVGAQEILASEDSLDDISSFGGSAKDTPRRSAPHHTEQDAAEEEVMPVLPASVNPVFQYILAPAKLAVCNKCHLQLMVTSSGSSQAANISAAAITDVTTTTTTTTTTTIKGNEVSLFSVVSPPELLDRHLKLGSDIHAKELTKIPLTSKETTNWTHFGGMPPADEVNILRGQILLMQNQLMYERHKRTNHAKRNRRLLRRIAHVATLEEQQKTLGEQVQLKEQEIQQLKVSIKLLQEDHRRLTQSSESDEYEKLVQFRTSLKENKDLKAERIVMKNLMLSQKEDYDKQQKKLENMQHKNLELEKQLEMCRERVANTQKLQDQVFQLQKEVLLMQELHQKCQEKLHQHSAASLHKGEHSCLTASLKADIAELRKENKKKSSLLEAYQTRNIELEEQLKAKDIAMVSVKKNFEAAKSSHEEQLKAVEERCQSMVHINQELESRLMELTCQLDQDKHRRMRQHVAIPQANKDGGGTSSATLTPVNKPIGDQGDSLSMATPHEGDGSRQGTLSDHLSHAGGKKLAVGKEEDSAGTKKGGGTSIVVAKDEVSVIGSTFTEASLGRKPPSRLSSISTRGSAELDLATDSGAASRSSYRVDSDASMQSISTQSLATGDSGCWPKGD